MLEHTCRQGTKLFVVVRIGTTLPPYTQASVPPFGSGVGGLHSIAGEGVGVQIRTRGQTLLVLQVYMYFVLEQVLLLMRSLLDLLTKIRTKTPR
jgi:hypothetical protein